MGEGEQAEWLQVPMTVEWQGENPLMQQIRSEHPLFARQSARIWVDSDKPEKPKDIVLAMELYLFDMAGSI